jgi:uncharacterized protein (DUF488 family)
MTTYTIGYGGRSPTEFLDILRSRGIRTIVDVRLRPDRASMGFWVKAKSSDKGIERLLSSAGIGYRWLPELGNEFRDAADWQDRYRDLLDREGETRTAALSEVQGPMCLMCAEKKVVDCHRLLIANYLVETAASEVVHLE